MKTKIVAILAVLLGAIVMLSKELKHRESEDDLSGSNQTSSLGQQKATVRDETITNRSKLPRTLHLEDSQLTPELVAMMQAYETGDTDEIKKALRALLENDPQLVLDTLSLMDGFWNTYSIQFPADVAGEFFLMLHGGPNSMELLGPYSNSSVCRDVLVSTFQLWLEKDSDGQFRWFSDNTSFTDGNALSVYVHEASRRGDALSIVKKVSSLPSDDPRRSDLYEELMHEVAVQHPAEFADYINNLSEIPPEAESALLPLSLAMHSAGAHDVAMEWILKEPSEIKRDAAIMASGPHWYQEDPEAFQRWLAKVDFEDETERAVVLERVILHAQEQVALGSDSHDENKL